MNGKKLGCGVVLGVLILIIGLTSMILFNKRTKYINLENAIEAQHTANKSNYDSMLKSAKEMAQVTDMYAEDFEKMYKNIVTGREDNPKLLFKLVKESNPNLDSEVYKSLQRELSANRKTFDKNQATLVDKIREYNSMVEKNFITSAILGKQKIDPNKYIVTSERTSHAFETGKDDEINLRGGNK